MKESLPTAESRATRPVTIALVLAFTILISGPRVARALCSATYVYPPPGNTIVSPHQALQISDPAGQQTATFDLYWGGALASLRYNGTEYLDQGASFATGGMLQVAMHTFPDGVHDYNPTQAGSNPYWPSTTVGASCNGSGTANLFSSMLDYYPTFVDPVYSVFNGQLQLSAYMTPYIIRTYADWVPANSGGSPLYYLRLTQYITNTGGRKLRLEF